MLTDQERGVLDRLILVWPTFRGLFKVSRGDFIVLASVFKDTVADFEVGSAHRVQQRVEQLLVLDPRTDSSLCELGTADGPQFFLSAFTVLFWISDRARLQLQISGPIDVKTEVAKLDKWLSLQQFNLEDMRKINERLRRESILLGFYVDVEDRRQMSIYRTPKEWRNEFKKEGLSHSATTWRRRRDQYEAKLNGKTYAFTKMSCEAMGLELPEFESAPAPHSR